MIVLEIHFGPVAGLPASDAVGGAMQQVAGQEPLTFIGLAAVKRLSTQIGTVKLEQIEAEQPTRPRP